MDAASCTKVQTIVSSLKGGNYSTFVRFGKKEQADSALTIFKDRAKELLINHCIHTE